MPGASKSAAAGAPIINSFIFAFQQNCRERMEATVQPRRLVNERISEELATRLQALAALLDGELYTDLSTRLMYATDASAYRELPLAVCRPFHENDIVALVSFAGEQKLTLIPRAAGTSLAGQVVGRGLVADISRHMTRILEVNQEERWVRVQPGVILDELNQELRPTGLFFSPETSTSNRCMIGGMIGNNSSGLHSVVYGTTREHLLSVRMVLSDGSVATFGELDRAGFDEKCGLENREGEIYRNIRNILDNEENRAAIFAEYPDPGVVRRNTGYALDELAACAIFTSRDAAIPPQDSKYKAFNFCKLIAGSEGTLGFITEATLQLDPLPPKEKALVPVHVDSVMEAIRGNLIALEHKPAAVELMDRTILELTEGNITQRKNRFFVEGNPGAILIVEFVADDMEEIRTKAAAMETAFRRAKIGYHFPIITGSDIPRAWNLRKAGLGVLSKMKGDAKPVSVIEDTSVLPSKLEEYITEFNELLKVHNLECVYHAHISVGELHLRPVLNLKEQSDVDLFHTIARETALLVKKYRGSLSGEHGDGRLRGEFIPLMFGDRIFALLKEVKSAWDPGGVFNNEKIIDPPPMNSFLRFLPGQNTRQPETFFDFSSEGGILRHIEQCNGSGDCRKTEKTGGTMCPSYMATREEWTTTRARANILREFIGKQGNKNLFDHQEVYDVLDLCLSCKACKSECPSSVDMARLKSEFLQHWYDAHGVPFRTRMIANITRINRLGALLPGVFNFFATNRVLAGALKKFLGFAPGRSIPLLSRNTVRKWAGANLQVLNNSLPATAPEVSYFVDEFTNYNDAHIGITTIKLLNRLGIKVFVYANAESGRTWLSKGLVRKARQLARTNVSVFRGIVNEERPLIGTEPSAILCFRDEYPELVGDLLKQDALALSENALMIEEYIARLLDKGLVDNQLFTKEAKTVRLHGHCQQKAIASTAETIRMLSVPENYKVTEIPSGCCGMAGSFGYEKEHYALSMKVGELVLFPEIRSAGSETIIAVPGTSCRHQVKDGTGVQGKHPVEILYDALEADAVSV
jgi:FAD/FMN-containing dehydrogenase/Fe-S oxidoreductase